MFMTLLINIPSRKMQEHFQIKAADRIWDLKMDIITKVRNFEDELNFGLVLVDHNKKSAVFLDESQNFETLGITSDVVLEFVHKGRLEWCEKEKSWITPATAKKTTKFMHEFSKTNGKNVSDRFIQILKTKDPNFQTDLGETPLSIAAMNEDIDMIELLVSNGALLDYRVGYSFGAKTPLQMAAANGKTKSVKKLIEMNSWIDAPDSNNLTSLYHAVSKGYGEICFRLLMAKANPNVADENGKSPLHLACIDNYDGILMLLIDFGGDMKAKNIAGNTPLHVAAGRNSDRCVSCLLKRGANRNVLNKTNQNPSKIAELAGLTDIVDLIQNFDEKSIAPPPKDPCPVTPQDSLIVNNVLKALQKKGEFQVEPAPISISNQTVIEKNLLKKEETHRSRLVSESSRDTDGEDYKSRRQSSQLVVSNETIVENPFVSDDNSDGGDLELNHASNSSIDKSIETKVMIYLETLRSKIDSFYIGEPSSNIESLLDSFTSLENSLKELVRNT